MQTAHPRPRCRLLIVKAPETIEPEHFDILNDAERAACHRLRKETHRARYTAAHALLRLALSDLLNIAPATIAIREGVNKRPELAPDCAQLAPGLDFNLSSTQGFVACAIGHKVRVGVDLERVIPHRADEAMLPRVLTHSEQEWLRNSEDPAAFFRLWTLKEALSKADGEGLGLPFNQILALPREDGSIDLDLRLVHKPGWHWRVLALQGGVPAALAIAGQAVEGDITINDLSPPGFQTVEVERLAEGRTL